MNREKILGLIFANMHDENIPELTHQRSLASVPFGARYRLIDFRLSSMVDSGIETVGVVAKSNYQSLMDHLGSGREWDLARRRGGLFILPPYGTGIGMNSGRVDNLRSILSFIESNSAKYVVIMDCDVLMNIDLDPMIDRHVYTGADITMAYYKTKVNDVMARDIAILDVDENERIHELVIDQESDTPVNASMNVMIIGRNLLIDMVKTGISRNLQTFERDLLLPAVDRLKIMGYEFKGYARWIVDLPSYFELSMQLLDPAVTAELFGKAVYTKVRDEAPAKYGLSSEIKNSMIADGCVIDGEVENSILFRGVHVKRGAKIRNSIVMQGSVIEENSRLNYVVTDKDCVISEGRVLTGYHSYPVFIAKGSRV